VTRDLDVRAFWRENAQCMVPFSTDKHRVPLTMMLDQHFILGVVGIPSTVRYFQDLEYRVQVNIACNDRLERELGRRFYPEETFYRYKGEFEVAVGARLEITEGNTPWIVPCEIDSVADLRRWTERANKMDLRQTVVTDDWYETKANFEQRTGKTLHLHGFGHTGPATLACNILGTTNVCLLMMDAPEVMSDFFAVLCDRYIEYVELVNTENLGYVPRDGFAINDDDCFLFSPSKYEALCAPYVQRVFEAFAPGSHHRRRHHSDSAMGHLMSILNDLGVNEVNLGPTIHPLEIRKALPNAVIHGQMPPFTLRDGSPQEIVETVRRDIECVGKTEGSSKPPPGSWLSARPWKTSAPSCGPYKSTAGTTSSRHVLVIPS
jgi:uroporphyrinogen decarboxylase